VRLAGRRTCDSDDVYPRPDAPPLMLPDVGAGLVIAVCGVGAYQQMISGRGGAHHCLSPEPTRVIISQVNGRLISRVVPQQDQATIMQLLGYGGQPAVVTLPFIRPAAREQVPVARPVHIAPTHIDTPSRRRQRERLRLVRTR
jgi:arginine decarboxylase